MLPDSIDAIPTSQSTRSSLHRGSVFTGFPIVVPSAATLFPPSTDDDARFFVKTFPEDVKSAEARYPRCVRSSADECRSPATEPFRSPAPFADRTALPGSRTCVEHPSASCCSCPSCRHGSSQIITCRHMSSHVVTCPSTSFMESRRSGSFPDSRIHTRRRRRFEVTAVARPRHGTSRIRRGRRFGSRRRVHLRDELRPRPATIGRATPSLPPERR